MEAIMTNFEQQSKEAALILAARYLDDAASVSAFFREQLHYSFDNCNGDRYIQVWEISGNPENSDDFYEMIGMADCKTPISQTRIHKCPKHGTLHRFQFSTKNPDLWCFSTDFREALDILRSQ